MALVDGDVERAAAVDVEFRRTATSTRGSSGARSTFADYYVAHGGNALTTTGRSRAGDLDYGVIEWTLPAMRWWRSSAIGARGSRMQRALLKDVLAFTPAAIIHLGDVYYSGTPEECRVNYTQVIAEVFEEELGKGKRVPVFSLRENHEYYVLGYGFYPTLATINASIPDAEQVASYFCLRTSDGGWQSLAMDTGYGDAYPFDQVDPWYAGPGLHDTEVRWLRHQLELPGHDRAALPPSAVLSARHAQRHVVLRELHAVREHIPERGARAYLGSDVAAWLWGHEHNFALYKDDTFGLAKGRLLGCSAYEELTTSEPYKVNYPQVEYLDPTDYRVGSQGDYYDHAYAIVDFSKRAEPNDPVSISYHQFPSWGETVPSSPESRQIYSEDLVRPAIAQ